MGDIKLSQALVDGYFVECSAYIAEGVVYGSEKPAQSIG